MYSFCELSKLCFNSNSIFSSNSKTAISIPISLIKYLALLKGEASNISCNFFSKERGKKLPILSVNLSKSVIPFIEDNILFEINGFILI